MQVIEAYENIGDENDNAYELSELLLYKNSIMVAAGDLEAALVHLQASCCDFPCTPDGCTGQSIQHL